MENSNLLKIDKPIRLIELFAGVGSQAKALQRLGVDFEHYKISEWEVNATASYKAIHKENDNTDYSEKFTTEELTAILFNIGISTDGKKPMGLKEIARKNELWKRTVYNNFMATNNIGSILNVNGADLGIVDTDKYYYLLTYSFPCQDLSLAGKGKGMAKGDNTRSGLLWEVERLLNAVQKDEIIDPFVVASRGRNPENPSDRTAGIPTEQRLEPNFSGCSNTLTTVQKDNYVCEPVVCEQRKDEGLRFFKGDYCGTLRTIDACGDKRVIEPKIIREEPLERDGWHDHAKEVISPQGVCRTLCAQANNLVTKIKEPCNLRIRKLTPKECWRLMGFDDSDFEKASKVNSNSQLYKQAGNSIVVDVLYYIFRGML